MHNSEQHEKDKKNKEMKILMGHWY